MFEWDEASFFRSMKSKDSKLRYVCFEYQYPPQMLNIEISKKGIVKMERQCCEMVKNVHDTL